MSAEKASSVILLLTTGTETMVCCKKGGAKVVVQERNGEELNQIESFRYLGSVICESGGCERCASEGECQLYEVERGERGHE